MPIDFNDPTPYYKQIAEYLRKKINSDKYPVGERLPSQREMAETFDVSMITIKKAIYDLINEGLLYSRVGKGTFVLRKSTPQQFEKHKTLGLVLSDLKSPYFSLIVHSVEKQASEEGYSLLVANSSGEFEKEERQIAHYLEMNVDGLIIASMSHEYRANKTIRKLHNEGYPYVVVSFIADNDIYRVGADQYEGAFMATQHLIDHEYQHIGYVSAEQGNIVGEIRKQGFIDALAKAHLPFDESQIYAYPYRGEWNDFDSGYAVGKDILKRGHLPEAFFIYNDLGALGFEKALEEEGITCPDDIAIIGFDDIERSEYCSVPLTTIRQPTENIGTLAVEKLINRINGENPEVQTILSPELVVRDSCGVHRIAERTTRKKEMRRVYN